MLGRKFGKNTGAENFIHIVPENSLNPTIENKNEISQALKIHITLKEDIENHQLGWNIVKHIFLIHAVSSYKIIKAGLKMSVDKNQRGKDITIYAGYLKHLNIKDWQKILSEITLLFVEHGVKPGYKQQSSQDKPEKIIKGSKYFSYRYYDETRGKSLPFPNEDIVDEMNMFTIQQPYDWQPYDNEDNLITTRTDKSITSKRNE